jgi:hypothetical protein
LPDNSPDRLCPTCVQKRGPWAARLLAFVSLIIIGLHARQEIHGNETPFVLVIQFGKPRQRGKRVTEAKKENQVGFMVCGRRAFDAGRVV